MFCSYSVFVLGWSVDDGVGVGDSRKGWRKVGHSLGGGGEGEASSLVELHVPDTTHGLDLRLVGAEVVVVSVVTALKQVLVASVSGVLVTHPAEGHMESRVNAESP